TRVEGLCSRAGRLRRAEGLCSRAGRLPLPVLDTPGNRCPQTVPGSPAARFPPGVRLPPTGAEADSPVGRPQAAEAEGDSAAARWPPRGVSIGKASPSQATRSNSRSADGPALRASAPPATARPLLLRGLTCSSPG